MQILSKGLSFSPKQNMEEFTVFKDINLFLHKLLFRFLHEQRSSSHAASKTLQEDNKKAIEDLLALLDEGPSKLTRR